MLWVFTVQCSSTYAAIKAEMKPCVCKTYREIQFSRLFSCSFVIWTTFYNPKWSSKRMQKNADCPICLKLLVSHLVVIQLHLSKQGHPQCRLVLSHPAMPSDHRLVVLLRKFSKQISKWGLAKEAQDWFYYCIIYFMPSTFCVVNRERVSFCCMIWKTFIFRSILQVPIGKCNLCEKK